MNISLPPEMAEFVKQQVEGGMYASASEVIREGLRLLRDREQLRRIRQEELKKQIAAGIEQLEQGNHIVLDENTFERIRTEGQKRLEELRRGQQP